MALSDEAATRAATWMSISSGRSARDLAGGKKGEGTYWGKWEERQRDVEAVQLRKETGNTAVVPIQSH